MRNKRIIVFLAVYHHTYQRYWIIPSFIRYQAEAVHTITLIRDIGAIIKPTPHRIPLLQRTPKKKQENNKKTIQTIQPRLHLPTGKQPA